MPTTNTTLQVEPTEIGMRLDTMLAERTGLSRSRIQRSIKEGMVAVNEKVVSAHYELREGEVITMREPEAVKPQPLTTPPTILAELPGYVILEKPSGLLVHPTPTVSSPTLIDWLKERYPTISAVGDPARPGVVHRLDREVSGIMVVATSPEMFTHLQNAFRSRGVKKQYTALVIGHPADDVGEIRFPLARSRRHHARIAARPVGSEGKEAHTKFSVLERFATTTLLNVEILTGRTHQIRAHLFAFGIPVVGDPWYRPKKVPHMKPIDRPFLHASLLGFHDLAGTWREFNSPLPEDLSKYLEGVGTKAQ